MKISYDGEVDALSITFRETTVTTKHLAEGIAADYDSEGRLAGLEILDAKNGARGKRRDIDGQPEGRMRGSNESSVSATRKQCVALSWRASAHDR